MAPVTIPSYTKAGLPPTPAAGDLARVTDSVQGVWLADGTTSSSWFSLVGEIVNVKDFGAIGNGTTDDTAALLAAIAAAPTGSAIFLPPGDYLFSQTLVLTKRVKFFGAGLVTESSGVLSGTRLTKSASLNGPGIVMDNHRSVVEGLTLQGSAGNGGDGITLEGNGEAVVNVAVFGMGRDGISVGPSGSNANSWRLCNVVTKNNTGHGVHIDSPIGEANGGVAVAIESSLNAGAGVRIGRGDFNTFVGLVVENNGANGIHLEATADRNTFVGGDFDEGNMGFDVLLAAGGTDNAFFGTSPTVTTISDNATRTKFFAANYNQLDTLRLTTDNGFKLVDQTSAGSTFAGTLSKAPHAGNPTFWLRVQINGSNRFIPCW